MKRKNKLIVIISILLLIAFAGYKYIQDRKKLNDELNNLLMITDIRRYGSLYKEDFEAKVKNIYENYSFRTNGQIKRLINDISKKLESGECFKIVLEDQLESEEIEKQVNEINNCSNNDISKIFIYTDKNLGKYINKRMEEVSCNVFMCGFSEKTIIDTDAMVFVSDGTATSEDKKSYDIKLSNNVDLLGFGESTSYCLLSNRFDPTMLREYLFLDLAKQMNLQYSVNYQFVEVYFDGTYTGCYLLTDSVTVGSNNVDIDIDSGDFLGEYDHSRQREGYTYFETNNDLRFTIKEPKEFDSNAYDSLKQLFDAIDESLYSNDFEKVKEIIDVESFAKLLLINEYAKTYDFAKEPINYYYKDSKLYAGPAFDFDISSGNVSIDKNDYYSEKELEQYLGVKGISYEGFTNWYNDPLINKLCEYDEFKLIIKNVFNEYCDYMRKIYADGGTIDGLLNKYSFLFNNNYASLEEGGASWPMKQEYNNMQPLPTYEDNVDYLKFWLENRFQYINNIIN